MKKRKAHLDRVTTKPKHEKLSWPGLKVKDHLSRVATRAVKEAKEARENEVWAENVIARVLDYVQPETAMKLLLQGNGSSRKAWREEANAGQKSDRISCGTTNDNGSAN
jgi:hypothetical protein